MTCPTCGAAVLDIDMKCGACGSSLAASGAHKMLGTVVLGLYELTDILGQGGMSVVFKGRHKMTDQAVALKILPPELAAHSQVKGRFLEEARALATLDHPNIVHLYNFDQENGCFILAMQFVEGRTWERLILENDRLEPARGVRIAIDVLRALEYAHGRGVVHRDMKPSNVLIRDHDQSATVMDFGIAKMTTSTRLTATGQTMGTVRYMSPEQVRGQEVDARTDLYSLGATLYESITGETPFDGENHFDIMTKHLSQPPRRPSVMGIVVPEAIEDALMRSLAKRADDRFQTAREMRLALEAALRTADVGLVETQRVSRDEVAHVVDASASAPIGASPRRSVDLPNTASPPASATELAEALAPARSRRRARVPWAAIAVFVVLSVGGGIAVYVLTRPPPAPATKPPPRPAAPHDPMVAAGKRVTADQVHAAYDRGFERVQKAIGDLHLQLQRPVVEHLVVVDSSGMCDSNHYSKPFTVDADCGEATQAVAGSEPTTLLVLDDPRKLDAAVAAGLAIATNTFQSFTVDGAPPAQQPEARDKVQNAVEAKLKALMDVIEKPPHP